MSAASGLRQPGNWDPTDPHRGQPLATAGRALEEARVAALLVHGRGATAESILTLAHELRVPEVAYLAPQAYGHSWYPQSFLSSLLSNEPGLSSGLAVLRQCLERIEAAGIPAERTLLLGFSQGACLTLEFAARNARRYGGVVAFSGGLIGPPGTPRDYPGSLLETPVFLGCSDRDPHIPRARVAESAEALSRLGGEVTERIYPGLGHAVNGDEVEFARNLLRQLAV
ncbi:MAG TPA: dienelactone hydrolase family protein [Thermoanaerobaculia bacterium]|nr:dienelactone hydrolase family protein [Thermoanaerobaculia bacterium]